MLVWFIINIFPVSTTSPSNSAFSTPFESSWVAFVIEGCALFLIIAIYLFCRQGDRTAKNTRVITFGLSLFDMIVDILFLVTLSTNPDPRLSGPLFIAATVFFVLPIALNYVWILPLIAKEVAQSHELEVWLNNHVSIAATFVFLSGKNPQSLLLLDSKIWKQRWLSANFSNEFIRKINQLGLIPSLLESIPQIIILSIKANVRSNKYGTKKKLKYNIVTFVFLLHEIFFPFFFFLT